MKNLIIPVAGKSSRFPSMRPKWLLTMPNGSLMIESAVKGLPLESFDRIIIVALKEHLDQYLSKDAINNILAGFGHSNIDLCVLDEPTASQSETVAVALRQAKVSGSFFIKDCDNYFDFEWNGANQVAVLDLNNVGLIDAKNKSYVTTDTLGVVQNIIEKQVISNKFCCGGYGFSSAAQFLETFDALESDGEIYISHVIFDMLTRGITFEIGNASNYIDWGTLREYRHYTRSYVTLFCDVDGVLLENGSKFGKRGWKTAPIAENLTSIAKLQRAGLLYLVITTSRPDAEQPYLASILAEFDIRPDRYVMGLPHSKRILVNDYSLTNPYPSAMAINLERDSKVLSSILDSINQS